MKISWEEWFDLCRSLGLLISPQDEERLYEALSSRLKWEQSSKTNEFIGAYCDAYKARWGHYPVISGRAAGVAKRLVDDLGLGTAKELVEVYVGMDDQFFATKGWDLATLENNLNKVKLKQESGRQITHTEARRMERRVGTTNAFAKLLKGSS